MSDQTSNLLELDKIQETRANEALRQKMKVDFAFFMARMNNNAPRPIKKQKRESLSTRAWIEKLKRFHKNRLSKSRFLLLGADKHRYRE